MWVQREKGVELAAAIGQETNREGGGVQERSCSSRSSAMAALWSSGAARHTQGQASRGLGEVEEGLEVLTSYSPRSIAAQARRSSERHMLWSPGEKDRGAGEEEAEQQHDELSVVDESSSASTFRRPRRSCATGAQLLSPLMSALCVSARIGLCLLANATCRAKDDGRCSSSGGGSSSAWSACKRTSVLSIALALALTVLRAASVCALA
jgi:hypothetical protein